MALFGKNSRAEQRLDDVSKSVQDLTGHLVRTNEQLNEQNNAVHSWIQYLYSENLKLHESIHHLAGRIASQTPLSKEQIKQLIDSHYAFDNILARIKAMEEKVEGVAALKAKVSAIETVQAEAQALANLRSKVQKMSGESFAEHGHQFAGQQIQQIQPQIIREIHDGKTAPSSMLQEHIVKRLVRNSKEYIKSSMLSMVRKYSKLTALQLRDIVVEEQGLCSKSSFYRLLDELEKESQLSVLTQGREKMYLARMPGKIKN